ncbi:MAG: FAD-dependent thymidylate synthase [Candidatus Kapabacteria bacterium]|nr:FAD-dependent thymidylate synthase [Ignavibacteriota bacterium]MCW5883448.1 FAD-dependent thymidylate synthase [Candidatus Kapabacteria bacterium]
MNINVKEYIEKEIKCLDKGFVRLIDVMGDDAAIVQSARVSYGKGTKSVNEDRGLIRYLMRHKHTSPFEMVEFKFHVKLPIFIARQWIRHRTANVNEYSGRYSEMKDEFYVPEISEIRTQSTINKQGRADESLPEESTSRILEILNNRNSQSFSEYSEMLELGLAREIARINLPLSNYTEWYWKIDLHNLFHFLRLRIDSHAQYEIQVYGNAIAEIVKAAVPMAWEAFEDYILNSEMFSSIEMKAIKELIGNDIPDVEKLVSMGLSKREAAEFLKKLE